MARVRKVLGDRTSESDQLFAMRSVSASSLEVVSHYAAGMEAQARGKFEEARKSLSRAVELDPNFGLGYQGLSAMSATLGQPDEAEEANPRSAPTCRWYDRARTFFHSRCVPTGRCATGATAPKNTASC